MCHNWFVEDQGTRRGPVGARRDDITSSQRAHIAIEVLFPHRLWGTVSRLAERYEISRQTVYEIAATGERVLVTGMKPMPLKLSVKSRRNRWFAYGVLAVMTGTFGILIIREGIKDNQLYFIVAGIALPFIFVIGEIIRFKRYCGKILAVWCVDCRHEFETKELCKKGRCPKCQSSRVVGLEPDDGDPVVTLY